MSLAGLLSVIADDPRLRRALDAAAPAAQRQDTPSQDTQSQDAQIQDAQIQDAGADLVAPVELRPFLAAALAAKAGRFVLAVTATGREADDLTAGLASVLPAETVATFPAWETLPHERLSPRSDTVGQRLAVLRRLSHPDPGDAVAGPLSVVVTPVRGLLQPIVAGLGDLEPVRLAPGQTADQDEVLTRLVEIGYSRGDLVEKRGDLAVRGGILDVFPPTEEHPLRIEFFGDTVEEIRYFKVADQLSLGPAPVLWAPPCRELLLTPAVRERAKELAAEHPGVADALGKLADGIAVEGMEAFAPVLAERMELLLDHVPQAGVVLACDPERIRARAAELVKTSEEFLAASWVNAAAGGQAPIDLGESAFRPITAVRSAADQLGLPWWTVTPFGATPADSGPVGTGPADSSPVDSGPVEPTGDETGRATFNLGASPAESYRGETR